jgi:phosphate starvation-inducible PhoH-like protein
MSRKKKLAVGLGKDLRLKEVTPKTQAQQDVFDSYDEGFNICLHGLAGTGKSFVSLYLAYKDILKGNYEKVVIVRSTVPSREVGFLPGTLEEKTKIYEIPYIAITNNLFGRGDAYNMLKEKQVVEFMTTSFERGITIDNAIVIVDEIQNMSFHELDTTITRLGEGCRLILSGDLDQTDLWKKNDPTGLPNFMQIIKNMESFDIIEFLVEDVVRSGLVKEYLVTKHHLGIKQ